MPPVQSWSQGYLDIKGQHSLLCQMDQGGKSKEEQDGAATCLFHYSEVIRVGTLSFFELFASMHRNWQILMIVYFGGSVKLFRGRHK